MKLPEIETIYRVTIAYYVESDSDELVSKKGFTIASELDIHLSDSGNGPCWNAYFVAQSETREKVEAFTRQICRYIKRFKNGKILDC